MRTLFAMTAGILLGATLTLYTRRYLGAFLWWLFARGDP